MRLVLWEQLILLIKCLLSTRIDCLKDKIIHHEQGLELYQRLKYKGVGTELAFILESRLESPNVPTSLTI